MVHSSKEEIHPIEGELSYSIFYSSFLSKIVDVGMNARIQRCPSAYNSQTFHLRTASNGGLGRDRGSRRCHCILRTTSVENSRVKIGVYLSRGGNSVLCRDGVHREQQEKAGAEETGLHLSDRMQNSDMGDGARKEAKEKLEVVDQAIGSVDGLVDDAVAWCGQHGLVCILCYFSCLHIAGLVCMMDDDMI